MPMPKCSWFITLGRMFALGILLLCFALLSLLCISWVRGRLYVTHRLSLLLIRVLGGKLKCQSKVKLQGQIVVSNHLSWIDPVLLLACGPMKFITSTDVEAQGFVGRVCKLAACAFVDRSGRNLRNELNQMHKELQNGHVIAFFPEATSSHGPVLPFKSAFFELALGSRCPVQLASIAYTINGASASCLYYYGDQEFLSHLWTVLRHKSWTAQVQWGPSLSDRDFPSRKCLSDQARNWIVQSLGT